MRFEIPEFKRCCFCVPLRYGLLVWSYLTLLPLALLLASQIMECMYIKYHIMYYGWGIVIKNIYLILLALGNLSFTFFLIVAAHKKSSKLLKIYSKCGLTIAIANFVTLFADFVYDISYFGFIIFILYFWIFLLMGLIFIGMQMYILALVRSEIIKLDSNVCFEFHNIGAEAEKDYYEPVKVKVDGQKDYNEPLTVKDHDQKEYYEPLTVKVDDQKEEYEAEVDEQKDDDLEANKKAEEKRTHNI